MNVMKGVGQTGVKKEFEWYSNISWEKREQSFTFISIFCVCFLRGRLITCVEFTDFTIQTAMGEDVSSLL